jgi:hypothetical protein
MAGRQICIYCNTHICLNFCTHLHLSNYAIVSRLFFNGGPARVARKPVMLLIPHFFQYKFRLLAMVALKLAKFVSIGISISISICICIGNHFYINHMRHIFKL